MIFPVVQEKIRKVEESIEEARMKAFDEGKNHAWFVLFKSQQAASSAAAAPIMAEKDRLFNVREGFGVEISQTSYRLGTCLQIQQGQRVFLSFVRVCGDLLLRVPAIWAYCASLLNCTRTPGHAIIDFCIYLVHRIYKAVRCAAFAQKLCSCMIGYADT